MSDNQQNPGTDQLLEEGMRLYGMGQSAEAAKLWSRVLEMEPEHPLAKEYLEIAREDLGQRKAASVPVHVPEVESAQIPAPAYSETVAGGIELMKSGGFENANEAFARAIVENAGDPLAHGFSLLAKTQLLARYHKVVGSLESIPQVVISLDELKGMDLSKEAGFILSLVDGMISCDDILTLARMDRFEAMGHLARLIEMGAIRS